MTQRMFEAVLAGCLPLTPATLPFASAFTPPTLHAANGMEVADRIIELQSIAGTTQHARLIADCFGMLTRSPARLPACTSGKWPRTPP